MQGIYVEKEGEGNWMKRDKSLQRIRGLLAAGAGGDPYFQTGLKKLVPCISESVRGPPLLSSGLENRQKVEPSFLFPFGAVGVLQMQSLRTQLALQACLVVSDMAENMKNVRQPQN